MERVDRQISRLPREKTWAYMRDYGCVLQEYTIDDTKIKCWCLVLEDRPLWFNPEEGKQA